MKFISDFTDFYDYAGIGYDSSLVYERKTQRIELSDKDVFNIVPEFLSTDWKIAVKPRREYVPGTKYRETKAVHFPFAIVFCGQIHVGIYTKDYVNNKTTFQYDPKPLKKQRGMWRSYRDEAEYNFFVTKRNNVRERMLELGYPILYITHNESILNPRLIDLGFHKRIDPVQAYQEMEMFVGELQSKEKDVKIADEYLKEQKGFGKCSFKNCRG